MVVEDNEADVYLIKKALGAYNLPIRVTVCGDGESVLHRIDSVETSVPGAIILDLSVPCVPGIELLRKVLSCPRFAEVPVMVFTLSPSPADKHRVQSLGSVRYVEKPSGLDSFLRAIGENVKEMLEPPANTSPATAK